MTGVRRMKNTKTFIVKVSSLPGTHLYQLIHLLMSEWIDLSVINVLIMMY